METSSKWGLGIMVVFLSQFALSNERSIGAGLHSIGDGDYGLTGIAVDYTQMLNDKIGLGVSLATGGSDNYQTLGMSVEAELDYAFNARAKVGNKIDSTFLYGSIGYSSVGVTGSASGSVYGIGYSASTSAEGSGVSLGVGADIFGGQNWGFSAEYLVLFGDLEDSGALMLTARYRL